ncbi:MAG: hypothetical protein MJY65_03530 [Bacteroidaceae bacterium]|nr:hypothetical protein [Bacteroidaceae bacterium]
MGLFNVREPRRIEHKYIYYDERKEKLKKIEENARRELGMIDEEEPYNPERIRGKFIEGTKYLKRRKESGSKPLSLPVALILIAGLLFVMHYLLTGEWFF